METSVVIPKGQMLGRIFDHQDQLELSKKMVQLFLDNGMDSMDLTELGRRNKAAQDQWYKYYRRSNRLTAFTTYTVLER